jgi:hypothetical protein
MRRSTGIKVVLMKLAIGQTLYESKMRPNSSCSSISSTHGSRSSAWPTHISKVLPNHHHRLSLHKTNQYQEHGLVQ